MHKCRHRIPFAINMAHSWTFWPCQDEKQFGNRYQPLPPAFGSSPFPASVAFIALFDQWQNATGKSCTNFIFRTPNCDHQCRLRDLTATSCRRRLDRQLNGKKGSLFYESSMVSFSLLLLLLLLVAALTRHLPALKLNFNLHCTNAKSPLRSNQNKSSTCACTRVHACGHEYACACLCVCVCMCLQCAREC